MQTTLGFAFGLFGVEAGGWTAVLVTQIMFSYYFSMMLFISTIMKEIALLFARFEEELEDLRFEGRIFQKKFREIFEVHYWVIE